MVNMPTLVTSNTFTVGDLVACRFPYATGTPKKRICAVVAIGSASDEVVLAYGTSNLRCKGDVTHALTVFRDVERQAAGLHKPTRFQVDRRVRMLTNDPRLLVHPVKGTAKVGHLPPEMAAELANMYLRLPMVSTVAERVGIHPIYQPLQRRSGFLRRRYKSLAA